MPSKLEEIEARRAARRAASDEKRSEQEATDLEAIEALEIQTGEELHTMSPSGGRFVPGVPVRIAFKAPSGDYYKRFCQQARKAGGNLEARGAAQDMLADVCWVYPPKDDAERRKAVLAAYPGVLVSIAIEAAKLAEFKADEEGKG